MTAPVLEVQGLQKYFPVSTGGLLLAALRLGQGGGRQWTSPFSRARRWG